MIDTSVLYFLSTQQKKKTTSFLEAPYLWDIFGFALAVPFIPILGMKPGFLHPLPTPFQQQVLMIPEAPRDGGAGNFPPKGRSWHSQALFLFPVLAAEQPKIPTSVLCPGWGTELPPRGNFGHGPVAAEPAASSVVSLFDRKASEATLLLLWCVWSTTE